MDKKKSGVWIAAIVAEVLAIVVVAGVLFLGLPGKKETKSESSKETEAVQEDSSASGKKDTEAADTEEDSEETKDSADAETADAESADASDAADAETADAKTTEPAKADNTASEAESTKTADAGSDNEEEMNAEAIDAEAAAGNSAGTAAAASDDELNAEAIDAGQTAGSSSEESAEAQAVQTDSVDAAAEPTPELYTTGDMASDIRASYQKLTIDAVDSWSASSQIQQTKVTNPPINIFDDDSVTNWQEGVSGPGIGENLTLNLKQSYEIDALTFKLGNWKSDKYFYGNNRPKTLTVSAGGYSWDFTFPDEWTEFAVVFSQPLSTSYLTVTIKEVYSGTSWDDTPITDILAWYK